MFHPKHGSHGEKFVGTTGPRFQRAVVVFFFVVLTLTL